MDLSPAMQKALANPRAARLALDREKCEDSLIHFLRGAWKWITPHRYVEGWHMQAIAEHLEAVTYGEINRLIINIPPRMTKSSLVSVAWPAWTWALKASGPLSGPSTQFLSASYGAQLATRDSVKSRRLIQSPWYQERWGGRFELTGDQNAKQRYDNDKGGYRLATSVGGALTGEGGDVIVCLPYGQRVETSLGRLPIGQVVEERLDCQVLGFDHAESRVSWQQIEAYESNGEKEIWEFDIGDRILRCTAEHPIFIVGRGYVRANHLQIDDVCYLWESQAPKSEDVFSSLWVRSQIERGQSTRIKALRELWASRVQDTFQVEEINDQRGFLQQEVFQRMGTGSEQSELGWWTRLSELCELWGLVFRKAWDRITWGEMLLEAVLPSMELAGWDGELATSTGTSLCGLREGKQKCREGANVLQALCGRIAQQTHSGRGQPKLLEWCCQGALCWVQGKNQASGSGTGPVSVRRLSGDRGRVGSEVARSPCGLRQDSIQPEPNDLSLPRLSFSDAWGSEEPGCVARATIRSVRRVGRERVYNLRLTPHHNYFAEGILVHNCDDPHNTIDIDSEAKREEAVQWWDEAMSTRLNDLQTGAYVIIMQRLFENDLTGHTLSQSLPGEWTHVMLPMEYDPSRHCRTFVNWVSPVTGLEEPFEDPRTIEGELLCPERVSESSLTTLKSKLGPFGVAGQLQQEPTVRGGAILEEGWWNAWPPHVENVEERDLNRKIIYPTMEFILASLDTAMTEKEENDPSAMTVWGLWHDKFGRPQVMLMEAFAERLSLHSLVTKVMSVCTRRKVDRLLVEAKNNGFSVAQEVVRLTKGHEWGVFLEPVKGDKVARAHACVPTFSAGQVWAPAKNVGGNVVFLNWAQGVISECAMFPRGEHDDRVDSTTQAINHLRKTGMLQSLDERKDEMRRVAQPPGRPKQPLYGMVR